MEEELLKFGARIKKIRETMKLNRQEMADRLGVAKSTYVRYENDEREPSLTFIQNLFRLDIDLDPHWLLMGEGKPPPGNAPEQTFPTSHLLGLERHLEWLTSKIDSLQAEVNALRSELSKKRDWRPVSIPHWEALHSVPPEILEQFRNFAKVVSLAYEQGKSVEDLTAENPLQAAILDAALAKLQKFKLI